MHFCLHGSARNIRDAVERAKRAEDLGFEAIFFADSHMNNVDPYQLMAICTKAPWRNALTSLCSYWRDKRNSSHLWGGCPGARWWMLAPLPAVGEEANRSGRLASASSQSPPPPVHYRVHLAKIASASMRSTEDQCNSAFMLLAGRSGGRPAYGCTGRYVL